MTAALARVALHLLPVEPAAVQRPKQQACRAFMHDNAARFAALFGHLLPDFLGVVLLKT